MSDKWWVIQKKELNKFDFEKDSTAGSVLIGEMDSAKNGKPNYCGIMTDKCYQEQAACGKLKEKVQHVALIEENPNGLEPHVIDEKIKEQESMFGVAVNAYSTWKRVVWKKTNSLAVIRPLKSLKRSGTELVNLELTKKKKQVSHDDQVTTIELEGFDV